MLVERAKAFYLPDGSYIKAEVYEGDVRCDGDDPRRWKSLDISLIHPDGKEEVLCCVDFEYQKGLRTIVYDGENADPVYEKHNGFSTEVKEREN